MLQRLGIDTRLDLVIFISLALLVATAPLGHEATHPIVLATYRTLLLLMTLAAARRTHEQKLPPISMLFLSLSGAVLFTMAASVALRPGSHFEGIYNFY